MNNYSSYEEQEKALQILQLEKESYYARNSNRLSNYYKNHNHHDDESGDTERDVEHEFLLTELWRSSEPSKRTFSKKAEPLPF